MILNIFLISVVILNLPNFPSQETIPWHYYEVKKGDTLWDLFGEKWEEVADFNRIDEKHLMIGQKIKIPNNLNIKYNPLPSEIEEFLNYQKAILIDLSEQWLGVYQNGKYLFGGPISSGSPNCLDSQNQIKNCETPTGLFEIMALDKNHVSSVYRDAENNAIKMPYALMFFIGNDGIAYWIHEGALPGYRNSHGCVRTNQKTAKALCNFVDLNCENNTQIKWFNKKARILVKIIKSLKEN